jgi:hypothetical protein
MRFLIVAMIAGSGARATERAGQRTKERPELGGVDHKDNSSHHSPVVQLLAPILSELKGWWVNNDK